MADKRIHELSVTSDKSGKFLALDEAGLPEALKFSADSLIDKAFTDTLYVKLAGDETVNGVKTWVNNGIFQAGITVTAGGIDVTGNSNINGTLGVDGKLTVTIGGLDVTGTADISDKLTVASGGMEVTGNSTINGTLFQNGGAYGITLSSETLIFSRNSTNYIHASTVGGNLVFITNGQAKDPANANLVLSTTQESYFNNNLGIGVSDPDARLDISSTSTVVVKLDTTASSTYIQFYNNGAAKGAFGWSNSGTDGMAFLNAAGTVVNMIISDAGNLGLGISSPAAKLHVDGGEIWFQSDSGAGSGEGRLTFNSTTKDLEISNLYGTDAANIKFNMSFGNIITMTRQGYIGLGTSTPEYRLDLGAITAGPAVRFFQTTAATGDSNFRLFMGTGTGVSNGDYLFQMGLRYDSTDDNNCGIRWIRGSGVTGGYLSLYAKDGTDLMRVGKDDGVVDIRMNGANGSSGFGGVLRVSNLDETILAGEESGTIEFYKADVSVNGSGVVSRIRSYSFDAGGTFKLGFHTGDSNSVLTERFTMSYLGDFIVNNAPSNSGVVVDASIVKNHGYRFDVGGLTRWFLYTNGTAEGGSDSGSNITFASYTDAGAFKTGVMNIDRATSRMGLGGINPSYQLDVQTNQTTEAYIARFYNDYKNKIGKGVIIRTAEDTPSGSPPAISLECQDGNGTVVGSLGYDTGSGFRVIDTLSSRKFKKNIKKTKIKGVEKLKAVRPRNYKWKGRTPEEEVIITERGEDLIEREGYVIEELAAVMPEVVSEITDENGETVLGYSPTSIIKYLHQAVIELTDRLEALETP